MKNWFVIFFLNLKARATQEIDKLKADRQSLVQRSNENTTKARQKNVDLLNKNKELEKQIIDLQVFFQEFNYVE